METALDGGTSLEKVKVDMRESLIKIIPGNCLILWNVSYLNFSHSNVSVN